MTRFGDIGRGAVLTLADRLRAAAAQPYVVAVEAIWQGGRATSLVTTYRAPLTHLDAVSATLGALHCNARLRLTEDGASVEWTISEPLPLPS